MEIKRYNNAVEAMAIIKGNIDEVFNYWFDPPQLLPPIKKIINLNFILGGKFQMLCMGPEKNKGKDILIDCIFRNIVKNKEITYEWKSMNLICVVTNEYMPLNDTSTRVITKQTVHKGNDKKEMVEIAHTLTIAYLAGMNAIFEKINADKS